ncbi:MAG: 1,4-dihydroxy-2-naphthoate polyprenyltransferase [Firmicutes bacterium ZCTH02-B6]|nr:MAG: 1,4-dihydroxy-2-naphthoate polyprenyltransferase [Firmicutes bacterium ZCTH02-B6]
MQVWILAARVPTLPAAVVPVLVGSATAWKAAGVFHPGAFLAALVASLLIQIGTNLANDLFDFKRGADTEARTGPVRVTHAGLLTPTQVARGTAVCFGLAFLVGLYLVYRGGWPVLAVGVASIAAGMLYTAGPWPLAYHGLGDVFAFLFFGVVAVVGTHYVHALSLAPLAWAASLPVGFLVTAILVVNNLRDIPTDRAAGKRTLAVRLGDRGTRVQYAALVAGAYAVPLGLSLAGARGPWVLLPFLSLAVSLPLVKTVLGGATGAALNPVLKGTGRLHLVFGLLFAVGLLLS